MARRSRLITIGLPLAALAAALGAAYSIARNQPVRTTLTPSVSPPVQPVSHAPTRSEGFIGAAGLVEPAGQQIDIGAHVSGIVAAVSAQTGQRVEAGAALFVLDERGAQAQAAIRRAELAAAERRLAQTQARIPSLTALRDAARQAIVTAQAELDDWADQKRSAEALKARGTLAITEREVTRRSNMERGARSRLAEATARAAQAEAELDLLARPDGAPTLEVERANVEQARQALVKAEVDLALLTVRAPISGTVLQVNVRPGQFAQAGALSTPLLVLGDLDPMHVRVDIDEVDIAKFRPEANAYASFRGQSTRRVELSFRHVEPLVMPKKSLTGSIIERIDTRVLRAVYALPTGLSDVFPGQQLDVFIEAASPPSNRPSTSDTPTPTAPPAPRPSAELQGG